VRDGSCFGEYPNFSNVEATFKAKRTRPDELRSAIFTSNAGSQRTCRLERSQGPECGLFGAAAAGSTATPDPV